MCPRHDRLTKPRPVLGTATRRNLPVVQTFRSHDYQLAAPAGARSASKQPGREELRSPHPNVVHRWPTVARQPASALHLGDPGSQRCSTASSGPEPADRDCPAVIRVRDRHAAPRPAEVADAHHRHRAVVGGRHRAGCPIQPVDFAPQPRSPADAIRPMPLRRRTDPAYRARSAGVAPPPDPASAAVQPIASPQPTVVILYAPDCSATHCYSPVRQQGYVSHQSRREPRMPRRHPVLVPNPMRSRSVPNSHAIAAHQRQSARERWPLGRAGRATSRYSQRTPARSTIRQQTMFVRPSRVGRQRFAAYRPQPSAAAQRYSAAHRHPPRRPGHHGAADLLSRMSSPPNYPPAHQHSSACCHFPAADAYPPPQPAAHAQQADAPPPKQTPHE